MNMVPFSHLRFYSCRSPVEWKTPSGDIALVNLELRMTSFSGYSTREAVDEGKWAPLAGIDYVGPQAHGTLWLHPDEAVPANWPVAPPIVAGKVSDHSVLCLLFCY